MSRDIDSGSCIILMSLKGHKLNCALRFVFEAILVGLRLTKEMMARNIEIKINSQLVINQINWTFTAKDKTMAAYLTEAIKFFIALTRLNSSKFLERKTSKQILCQYLQAQKKRSF